MRNTLGGEIMAGKRSRIPTYGTVEIKGHTYYRTIITDSEGNQRALYTVKALPPYVFVMLGLYAGLRREESLALQWDRVFLDVPTPYISVWRAWRGSHRKEPEISTVLKTPTSRRDIPIPKCLVECLREAKQSSKSAFVISNRKGGPLSEGEFVGVWYMLRTTPQERKSATNM